MGELDGALRVKGVPGGAFVSFRSSMMKQLGWLAGVTLAIHMLGVSASGETIFVRDNMTLDGSNTAAGDRAVVQGLVSDEFVPLLRVVDGAELDLITVEDFGIVDIVGGTVGGILFEPRAVSKSGGKVNISGGTFTQDLRADDNGTFVISGGVFAPTAQMFLSGAQPGTIHVFGQDLRLETIFAAPDIPLDGAKQLVGTLADGTPIDIPIRAFADDILADNVFLHNVVPEPAAWVLAACGGAWLVTQLRRRRTQ